jgi:hypothetical protein
MKIVVNSDVSPGTNHMGFHRGYGLFDWTSCESAGHLIEFKKVYCSVLKFLLARGYVFELRMRKIMRLFFSANFLDGYYYLVEGLVLDLVS